MRSTDGVNTWANLRAKFVAACGGSQDAANAWASYLHEANVEVAQRGKDSENFRAEAEVTIDLDPNDNSRYLDYVELVPEMFYINSCVNATTGYPMSKEPDGWEGRLRYMEPPVSGTRLTPGQGGCLWWVRQGTRLYVRNRPDVETTLRLSYRINPQPLTEADFNEYPRTPAYYDMAIVFLAAKNFFLLNPAADVAPGGQPAPSVKYATAAEMIFNRKPEVEAEEDKRTRFSLRIKGFDHRPRSRR